MKSFYSIIMLLFLMAFHSLGQNVSKKYSLPGFVQLNDSLFISVTEIDIREYARFLVIWREKSGDPEVFQKAFPSPNYLGWTLWNEFSHFMVQYSEQYEVIDKNHWASRSNDTTISWTAWISNWPVVNVTKQQANLYCEFRTKDYEFFYTSLKRKKKEKYPAHLVFRLPTATEWISAASSGLDTTKYKFGVEDESQKHSLPVSLNTFANDTTGQLHPYPVILGQLNKFKILNMCGNIAELVSDDNLVYGGSFSDTANQCAVTSKKEFIEPKNNIGFRVVAVIRNK